LHKGTETRLTLPGVSQKHVPEFSLDITEGRIPHTFFWCGHAFADLFITATFAGHLKKEHSEKAAYGEDDVLVFASDGSACASNFPGRVIYLNGEPYKRDEVPDGALYIGPKILHSGHSIQLFYVSLAALEVGLESSRPKGSRTHFLIYTTSNCVRQREKAFNMLATVDKVTAAGACHGNVSHENVRSVEQKGSWQTNINLFRDYKFALVMESTYLPGYVSEKILVAFLSGCIPIYFGTEDVFQIFNERAFVYMNMSNPEPAILQIKTLHESPEKYEVMASMPMLAAGAKQKFFEYSGELREQIEYFLVHNRLNQN